MFPFKKQTMTATDHVYFGDKRVEIPRLSVGKWETMIERIETLPQNIVAMFAARDTEMFWPTVNVGVRLAMEEIVTLVAVLADITEDEVREADLIQLHDFIKLTVERNNLDEAAKKYRTAVLSVWKKIEGAILPS